ncbi:MAG TPA: transglycosylase SLT domain-containing protein [Nitrospirota bacterium]|nr:transglycosylase SLT domain-containing protein [Nitrospirota bacterium]
MKKINYILIISIIFLVILCPNAIANKNFNINLIMKYSQMYDIDPSIPLTIATLESGFRTNAFNKNVKKIHMKKISRESHGVMQLTLITGKFFNPEIKTKKDLYDPEKNIKASILFIKYLLDKHKNASLEDIASMYNSGEKEFFRKNISTKYRREFLIYHSIYKQIAGNSTK